MSMLAFMSDPSQVRSSAASLAQSLPVAGRVGEGVSVHSLAVSVGVRRLDRLESLARPVAEHLLGFVIEPEQLPLPGGLLPGALNEIARPMRKSMLVKLGRL